MLAQYAQLYEMSRKRDKGLLLDEVTRLTGWSRDHARRQMKLALALDTTTGVSPSPARPNFSDAAIRVIRTAWWASGGLSGRYLVACLPELLDALERHGHVTLGENGHGDAVRDEILQASPATVDRFSMPTRRELAGSASWRHADRMHRFLVRSRARTWPQHDEPGHLQLRIRKQPLLGTGVSSVILVDACTGWMAVASVRSHHYSDLAIAYAEALQQVPFEVIQVADTAEVLPRFELARWAARHQVPITQAGEDVPIPPITDLSRRQAHQPPCAGSINRIWNMLTDRLNFWVPRMHTSDPVADRQPEFRRPISSLLDARVLSMPQVYDLKRYHRELDPFRTAGELERLVARISA
jgi:hypothetical protein